MDKMYKIDALPPRLVLGRQTETGVEDVRFDCTAWLTRWPEMEISVWPVRPGDIAAYPAVVERAGNVITWIITDVDTAVDGEGSVEVMGIADGKRKLSARAVTHILASGLGNTQEPPEGAKPWVDEVLDAAKRAENAAEVSVHPPIIGTNNNWWLWDAEKDAYADSGKPSQGAGGGSDIAIDTTLSVPGAAADAAAVGGKIEELSEEIVGLNDVCYIESPNLYNPALQTLETISEKFFSNGAPYATDQFDSNYDTSAPIPVEENTQYTIGYVPAITWGSFTNLVKPWNMAAQGMWFYGENDTYLGRNAESTFVTPAGTKYIRFMFATVWQEASANLENANARCMLVKGASLPATYVSYGKMGLGDEIKKLETSKTTFPVRYYVNGDEIKVGSRYNDSHDMMVTLKKKGGNNVFDFYQFSLVPIGEPLEGIFSTNSITLQTTPTDWHAPYQMSAVNDADGDAVDSHHWTGGNHEYTNTGTGGTPTARTASVIFVADGKAVTEGSGYCNRLEILWTDFSQAYNTKKADGTGREVLESRHVMTFDGVKWETKTELEPLEDIVMDVSYGLQLVCGGLYDKVRYYGAVNRAEYETTSVKTTSGNKDATAMYWHGDAHAVMLEIDPAFDIGDRQFYNGTDGIFTTEYGKGYCNFFANTPLTAGNIYSFRGSYRFAPYRGE